MSPVCRQAHLCLGGTVLCEALGIRAPVTFLNSSVVCNRGPVRPSSPVLRAAVCPQCAPHRPRGCSPPARSASPPAPRPQPLAAAGAAGSPSTRPRGLPSLVLPLVPGLLPARLRFVSSHVIVCKSQRPVESGSDPQPLQEVCASRLASSQRLRAVALGDAHTPAAPRGGGPGARICAVVLLALGPRAVGQTSRGG